MGFWVVRLKVIDGNTQRAHNFETTSANSFLLNVYKFLYSVYSVKQNKNKKKHFSNMSKGVSIRKEAD